MKAQISLLSLFSLLCTGLPALGQEAGMGGPTRAVAVPAAPAHADRQLLDNADKMRQKIVASLSDYVVVFTPRNDTESQRVGIPFTAFTNLPLHLAYDPISRQMMAQWTLGSLGLNGQTMQYQAYMDGSGTLRFALSAKF
jgi:hypothetical protein